MKHSETTQSSDLLDSASLKKLTDSELKRLFVCENMEDLPDDGILGDLKRYVLSGKKDFTMGQKINEVERLTTPIVVERWMASIDNADIKSPEKELIDSTVDPSNSTVSFFLGETQVVLENKGEGKGNITIIDKERGMYQMYWGAMGSNIQDFLVRINEDYFADKLLGPRSTQVFDVRSTFASLRRFIRKELEIPWYKHLAFQSDLREKLNYFQDRCEEMNCDAYFIDNFDFNVCKRPDFYLISDRFERERIESEFEGISEPWLFIRTKDSQETRWLKALHARIKRKLL